MTTGDQGTVDDEGYITFVGRDDDVITSAGYRIGPGEIEDCLIKHPAVALAAVIGKPDPVRTEIVKAFIVLKPGVEGTDALAAEVRDFVKTRLSAHEYPREVSFITRDADDHDRQDHPPAAARSGLSYLRLDVAQRSCAPAISVRRSVSSGRAMRNCASAAALGAISRSVSARRSRHR